MTRSRTYFGNYTICDLFIQANTELRSNRNSGRKSRSFGRGLKANIDEIRKQIPGYEGRYEASSHGRIRSVDHVSKGRWGIARRQSRVLSQNDVHNGYKQVKCYNQTNNPEFAENRNDAADEMVIKRAF